MELTDTHVSLISTLIYVFCQNCAGHAVFSWSAALHLSRKNCYLSSLESHSNVKPPGPPAAISLVRNTPDSFMRGCTLFFFNQLLYRFSILSYPLLACFMTPYVFYLLVSRREPLFYAVYLCLGTFPHPLLVMRLFHVLLTHTANGSFITCGLGLAQGRKFFQQQQKRKKLDWHLIHY